LLRIAGYKFQKACWECDTTVISYCYYDEKKTRIISSGDDEGTKMKTMIMKRTGLLKDVATCYCKPNQYKDALVKAA
jgi:hypothetical protein